MNKGIKLRIKVKGYTHKMSSIGSRPQVFQPVVLVLAQDLNWYRL